MRKLTALLAIAGAALCTTPVLASDTVTVGLKPGFTQHVYIDIYGYNEQISAGTFTASLNGGPTFDAYCADLFHELKSPYDVNVLTTDSIGAFGGDVGWLYSKLAPTVTTLDEASALQLAIWDTEYDGGDGFSSGYFKVTSAPTSVITLANQDLALWNHQYGVADYFQAISHPNGQNQDIVGIPPTTPTGGPSVPEPAAGAVFGIGLLSGTAVIRRRRRA